MTFPNYLTLIFIPKKKDGFQHDGWVLSITLTAQLGDMFGKSEQLKMNILQLTDWKTGS